MALNYGGAASGALKGASMGTMVMPGVGTAIGAGIGGLYGLFKGKNKTGPGGTTTPEMKQNIMGRYEDFANTGGYSPGNIADMRARAISPSRAIYANMQRNIDRQRALQGGYSPNYTAASAKLAREGSQEISDINQNVNAD